MTMKNSNNRFNILNAWMVLDIVLSTVCEPSHLILPTAYEGGTIIISILVLGNLEAGPPSWMS